MNKLYFVIMAGGEGTRFYPLSTPDKPKQFLNFIGDKSFLRQTFERILPLTSPSEIFISTNEKYIPLVAEQLPEIPLENIIGEPVKKNTAPALAYITALILKRFGDVAIGCFPSDHYIKDEDGFRARVSEAADIASLGNIVTLGICPDSPSIDYGYILPTDISAAWSKVKRFAEKPDSARALKYIKEGYLWNAGMFIWQASQALQELARFEPSLYEPLANIKEGDSFLRDYFKNAKPISIDYAVMERSDKVAVIPSDFGWSDVGTWESVVSLIEQGVNVSQKVRSLISGDEKAPWRRIVPKPWGHEEWWAMTDRYVGKILFIKKGSRLSLQYHKVKDETMRLLSGHITLELADKKMVDMLPGDVIHIPPMTTHRVIANSDSLLLEVSTPEVQDVVRVEDDYGR